MSVPMRWQQPIEPIEPQVAAQPRMLPQRRRAARQAQQARFAAAMATLFTLCAAAGVWLRFSGMHAEQQNGLQSVPILSRGAQVALISSSVERNLGFVTVTGAVQNRTARPLAQVEAVVELLDAQHSPVAVESALIGEDRLRAGENSPFRVEMNDNARAVGYRVHFRKLLGPALN